MTFTLEQRTYLTDLRDLIKQLDDLDAGLLPWWARNQGLDRDAATQIVTDDIRAAIAAYNRSDTPPNSELVSVGIAGMLRSVTA